MRIWKKKIVGLCVLCLLISIPVTGLAGGINEDTDPAEQIPDSWFDRALFIGDSLTGSLSTYAMLNGGLGDAKIIHVNGLGCHHFITKNALIFYAGRSMPVEDVITESGSDKVFFMLAMNDIGTPIEKLRSCWQQVVERIQAKNPDVEIYIQSGTPMRSDFAYFTKANMEEYNQLQLEICESYGCTYVDVTVGMLDEDGYMKEEYRKDNVHLNRDGCAVWMRNLHDPSCYSIQPVF